MADFWADDLNPKGVGYLSLRHPEPAKVSLRLALDLGISAIWIACDAVEERAPSLIVYDPLWAMLHDAVCRLRFTSAAIKTCLMSI